MNGLKNKFLIALIFGFYQALIGLFFGSHVFLESTINLGIYLGVVFTVISLIQFIILLFLSRKVTSEGIQSIFFSISFLVTGLLGGTFTYLMFANNFQSYLIYIASFLISAFLPTVLFLLNFIYQDADQRISAIRKTSIQIHPDQIDKNSVKLFHLENENGKILLEVPIERIICFEANDNYVITYYLDKQNSLKRSMERVSLKRIEEILALENINFYRVHKSFLINPDFLEEIKGKAQAYKVKLRDFEMLIPVSRSYDITILEKSKF